jgi:hypothetical protein
MSWFELMSQAAPPSTGNFGFWVVLGGVYVFALLCAIFFGSSGSHQGNTGHPTAQQIRLDMIQKCQDTIDKSKHLWPAEMQKYASAARAKCWDD